jgi:fucokinase
MGASATWDYLVLTASNAGQAEAYELQLNLRRERGVLPQVREALVVPDPDGKRIGSGGSTLLCLRRILERERSLHDLRILIIHAGGDSRRLPAYGPSGKIFVPLPGSPDGPLPVTLFDRLVPDFLALPPGGPDRGQVIVAAGDALIRFDASQVRLSEPGLIALGCYAAPLEASRHGVFCLGDGSAVSLYLQKPSIEEQKRTGALTAEGSVLDLGVMSMDGATATSLLDVFEGVDLDRNIDLYREICCAMGTASTAGHYVSTARAAGSAWSAGALMPLFPALNRIPLRVQLVPSCRFLHFGSTRQLIESGLALTGQDHGLLVVNSRITPPDAVRGPDSWIEACRISAGVQLGGRNVLVGVDIDEPLSLPPGACLEVLPGRSRAGNDVWFVRCYGVRDTFKNGSFCDRPLTDWLRAAGLDGEDVWPPVTDAAARNVWNARLFPAEPSPAHFRRWLWAYAPESATEAERRAFRAADRYSAAEIAVLASHAAFHARRLGMWNRALSR